MRLCIAACLRGELLHCPHLSIRHDKNARCIDDCVDAVSDDQHGGVVQVRADGGLQGRKRKKKKQKVSVQARAHP